MRKDHYHIIIVGGGASGMAAALAACRYCGPAERILLLEKMDRLGSKLPATGNGRCNLTNEHLSPDGYRSQDPEAVAGILSSFGLAETLAFFRRVGILTKSQNGLVYPFNEQASSVRLMLERALYALPGLDILTGTEVREIHCFWDNKRLSKERTFRVTTACGNFRAGKVIIAVGGYAGPSFGCCGDGYRFAEKLGHSLIKPLPALTALLSGAPFLKKMSGLRTDALVRLFIDHKEEASDRGQVQWTDHGVSGIVIFQLSRFASLALDQGREVSLLIDFMPDHSAKELVGLLKEYARPENTFSGEGRTLSELMSGIFHQKLLPVLIRQAKIDPLKKAEDLSGDDLALLVSVIKGFPLRIRGTAGYEKAQVTRGGVPFKELDENLESLIHPGLFFAGELVDVDGICGGYNLQWAWSSGFIAGKAACGKGE